MEVFFMQAPKYNCHLYRQITVFSIVAAFFMLPTGCAQEAKKQSGPPPVTAITAVTVQPQRITLTKELPGRTTAYRVAEIRPQVNGLIQKRLFTEGADVKAGDVLYQIDPSTFEAALNNAKAALGRSEANLPAVRSRMERYQSLLAEKAVSQQDYDDAFAALKQAEADVQYWKATVETARINLAYTRITAPISGRIGRSNVTEGAIVTAYQPVALATINQLDPIYVDVPQSTTELLRLKRHLQEGRLNKNGKNLESVTLLMEDGTAYPLNGTLQFQDVAVDPSTGSVILRAVFPNPDGFLLPGMFVRTFMKEGVADQAILIPQQSVARDPKGNPVALIVTADNKVEQRMLVLDRAIGAKWLVASGLAPGDRVIVEGILKVRPGMSVQATPFTDVARNNDQTANNRASAAPKSN